MKTGKKIALLLLMVLNFGSLSGQSSKNSRKEYVAVDNHTYKRGEAISFGSPSRGKTYGTILIKDIVTVRDYIDTMNGTEIGKKEAVNATEEDLARGKERGRKCNEEGTFKIDQTNNQKF